MNSSILRADWYSFMAGTNICSMVGILATSSYLGIRIRFSRNFLFSTSASNGSTVFLYRIKEPGNWIKNGARLFCKIFEKNLVAGAVYVITEKYFSTITDERLANSFVCGGILGLYSCISYNYYSLQDSNMCQILLYWLASAELSALFEVRKVLFTIEPYIPFTVEIPFQALTFWNGAVAGTLIGIQDGSFLDILDEVFIPEIEDEDSNWVVFLKCAQLVRDCCYCTLEIIVCINERFLAGGIIQCGFEYYLHKVLGLEFTLLSGVISGCLHGIYLGIMTGNAKNAMKLSWTTTSVLRIIPWICLNMKKMNMLYWKAYIICMYYIFAIFY